MIIFEQATDSVTPLEWFFGLIQDNSVLVGIVSSIFVSAFWMRKFLRQKRAEAFFGFHTKLLLQIKNLRAELDIDRNLEVTDPSKGNIFSLIYTSDHRKNVCSGFGDPPKERLALYKKLVARLKKIIVDEDNNVYPRRAKRRKWYESLFIILRFCEFIENEDCWGNTNIPTKEEDAFHIVKCQELLNAFDYIQTAIERERY